MFGFLRADLLKTRKRAMGWVMLAIIAAFVPLQMLPGALLMHPVELQGVLLQSVVPVPFVGILIMIILGAVLVGSEYGYDTRKNLLTRRAGRIPFLLSKWLVLIVVMGVGLLILVPLGLVVGFVLSATLRLDLRCRSRWGPCCCSCCSSFWSRWWLVPSPSWAR